MVAARPEVAGGGWGTTRQSAMEGKGAVALERERGKKEGMHAHEEAARSSLGWSETTGCS